MTAQKTDTPDTPPEVLARQGKSRALTPQTVALMNADSKPVLMGEDGRLTDGYATMVRQNKEATQARTRAEAFAGGTPFKGLTTEQVAEIRGKSYDDAPTLDPELGDRTPAFVNWLWLRHPVDAKVRYGYRDIWPTKLPAAWPLVGAARNPDESVKASPEEKITAITNMQAELDRLRAENAALQRRPAVAANPKKRAPRSKVAPAAASPSSPS